MTSSLNGFGGMKSNTGATKRGGLSGDVVPKGYRVGQLQQFTPEQMNLFQQMFGHLGADSPLSKMAMGDEDQFEQMEAPAHRMFQGQMGQLASRFSGMGQGGRHSSGFQNTATAANSNFSQDLASKRQQLQRQALNDLMGFSNQMLGQRPQERFLTEKEPSFFDKWLAMAGRTMGAATKGASAGGF